MWDKRIVPAAGTRAALFYEVTAGRLAVVVNKLRSLCPSPHSQSSHLSNTPHSPSTHTHTRCLNPKEIHRLFPWHPFTLLPSDSVCTALRLCAASLTH